jgi:hypothetical protein
LELDKAAKLLDEGNSRLAAAVVSKNFHDIEVAQLLISNATKKLDTGKVPTCSSIDQINQLRKKLRSEN